MLRCCAKSCVLRRRRTNGCPESRIWMRNRRWGLAQLEGGLSGAKASDFHHLAALFGAFCSRPAARFGGSSCQFGVLVPAPRVWVDTTVAASHSVAAWLSTHIRLPVPPSPARSTGGKKWTLGRELVHWPDPGPCPSRFPEFPTADPGP